MIDAEKRNLIKVVDKEVFDAEEKSLALSKEKFAELIFNHVEPFDNVDLTGFEDILNILQGLIKIK